MSSVIHLLFLKTVVDPVALIHFTLYWVVPSSLVSKSLSLSAFPSGTVLALILCSLFCSVFACKFLSLPFSKVELGGEDCMGFAVFMLFNFVLSLFLSRMPFEFCVLSQSVSLFSLS
ncbi:hypothetical protein VNO78_26019 [Psophocarpus tetragonolobus]|uniref:Uncharacterized protein n=1 Tax=Psophocarpus tetragonolobus TaxID=3891 RepID=A0AAN9XFX3_PSOTE